MPGAGASVFIVDDHSFFRAGLRSLLVEHGFEVVGEAGSGEAALPLIERRRPDVVVMDLNMPEMSGAEATRRICERSPAPAVLVLTVSTGQRDVIEALEAGAAGYLLKDSEPDAIARGIRSAIGGDTPISPRVARILVERARGWSGASTKREPVELSDRELEVLRLLADGMDNAEIAERLFVSPTTVKRHVSAIFTKLGVANRVQAAIEAVRSGVI
jgi:two-component system nitrate/nitrite response regulator NarL